MSASTPLPALVADELLLDRLGARADAGSEPVALLLGAVARHADNPLGGPARRSGRGRRRFVTVLTAITVGASGASVAAAVTVPRHGGADRAHHGLMTPTPPGEASAASGLIASVASVGRTGAPGPTGPGASAPRASETRPERTTTTGPRPTDLPATVLVSSTPAAPPARVAPAPPAVPDRQAVSTARPLRTAAVQARQASVTRSTKVAVTTARPTSARPVATHATGEAATAVPSGTHHVESMQVEVEVEVASGRVAESGSKQDKKVEHPPSGSMYHRAPEGAVIHRTREHEQDEARDGPAQQAQQAQEAQGRR